jgi:hypothetical protein
MLLLGLCQRLHPWRQLQYWQWLLLLLGGRLLLCKGLHSCRQSQRW